MQKCKSAFLPKIMFGNDCAKCCFSHKNVVQGKQKFAFSSVKVLRRETLPSPQLEKVKQAIAKCNTLSIKAITFFNAVLTIKH